MALLMIWSLLTLITLVRPTLADTSEKQWLTPDGSKPDFSNSFVAGNTMTVAWKTLNNSRSDLWLTHYNVTAYPWHYQVASNIDISNEGSYSWYINVPASTITTDSHFTFHFFPLNSPYSTLQASQFSSPGFLLAGGVSTTAIGGVATVSAPASQFTSYNSLSSNTTSITNSSTTNTAGSTITATVTTAISVPTTIPSQNTKSDPTVSSFPLAAQAGIGVGAGIFIIILFAAGCFFGRRIGLSKVHEKYDLQHSDTIVMQSGAKFGMFGDECTKVVREVRPSTGNTTLTGMEDTSSIIKADRRFHQSRTPLVELMGSSTFPVEKAGSMIRPGVYEVH